jgi:hypothetical protein
MTLRGPDGTGSTPRSGHAYSGVGRGPDSQNESDSRLFGNRIIIPPRLLPLLPMLSVSY